MLKVFFESNQTCSPFQKYKQAIPTHSSPAWEHPMDPFDQLSALALAHSRPRGLVLGIPSDRHRWSAGQDNLRGSSPKSGYHGGKAVSAISHCFSYCWFHSMHRWIWIWKQMDTYISQYVREPPYPGMACDSELLHQCIKEITTKNQKTTEAISVRWHNTDLHMTSITRQNMSRT